MAMKVIKVLLVALSVGAIVKSSTPLVHCVNSTMREICSHAQSVIWLAAKLLWINANPARPGAAQCA